MEKIKHAFLCSKGNRPSLLALYECTDSTNERAKQHRQDSMQMTDMSPLGNNCEITAFQDGIKDTALFIAKAQSCGRGRLGRRFESPPDAGLYMSLKIKLNAPLKDSVYVTPTAAVAAALAIKTVSGADVKIKWVNDLYLGGRKLAGILTESIAEECTKDSCTLVIGIGINVKNASMSDEIADIATSLEAEGFLCDKGELAAEITSRIISLILSYPKSEILGEYRSRSYLTGEQVKVITPADTYKATVMGIGDDFELVIKCSDGSTKQLTSGDVQRIRAFRTAN